MPRPEEEGQRRAAGHLLRNLRTLDEAELCDRAVGELRVRTKRAKLNWAPAQPVARPRVATCKGEVLRGSVVMTRAGKGLQGKDAAPRFDWRGRSIRREALPHAPSAWQWLWPEFALVSMCRLPRGSRKMAGSSTCGSSELISGASYCLYGPAQLSARPIHRPAPALPPCPPQITMAEPFGK